MDTKIINDLDELIRPYVLELQENGFDTYTSCQGAMPNKDSEHSFWQPTICIHPAGKHFVEFPDDAEVYEEYLRLIKFVSKKWPVTVDLQMISINDNVYKPSLNIKWMLPLDWKNSDKLPPFGMPLEY